MKCNTCQEQQQDSGIVNMLKRTGYPIHNVCISEYFEKVGQKQMDLICATFNSVHMGYMMNLLHYSKDSKNSPNPFSLSVKISISKPVNSVANFTFCPLLPIAKLRCSSETTTSILF